MGDPIRDLTSTSPSADEEGGTPTARAPQVSDTSSRAPRFGRSITDWLRRNAINRAMRNSAAEPSSGAPPVPAHGLATSRGLTPGSEDSMEPYSDSPVNHSGEVESSPQLPGGPRYNAFDSSPLEVTRNPGNWLLPHPFRHDVGMPFVTETSYKESQGTERNVNNSSLPSTGSLNERGLSSGASTPISLREQDTLTTQSTYFGQERTVLDSSDGRINSPLDSAMDTSSALRFSVTAAAVAAHPSAPVVGSEPDYPELPYRSTPRDRHSSSHEHTHSGTSYLGARQSTTLGTDSGPLGYRLEFHGRLGPHEARPSPYAETERAYGASVMSGALAQTLTPNTSPYGRGMAPVKEPGRFSAVSGHDPQLSAVNRPGKMWRQATLSPVPQVQLDRPFTLRSPFQYAGHDSSIISPTPHPLIQRHHPRHATNVDERSMAGLRNKENDEPQGFLDLNLGSSSESESDGVDNHTGRPARHTDGDEIARHSSTPGLVEDQDHVICAISESRSSDIIGMTVMNVTLGLVDIIRIVNDDRYRRLTETLWRMPTWPQTFLVLKKVVDQQGKSSLGACLTREFPQAKMVTLDREHWNESEGLKMVDRFAWRKDIKAIRRNLEHNFYASCAFAAVIAYVEEETDVVFRENSLRVKYQQPADTMGLDRSTITSLELFQNVRTTKGTSSTLFGLLNKTLTPQGRRMIRSALLQPSTNKDKIVARHEAVEELSSNEDLFTEVRASLKRLLHIDIERFIPWVALKSEEQRLPLREGVALIQGRHQITMASHEELRGAEQNLNQLLMIKAYLGGVQAVRETLEAVNCRSKLCQWVLETCGPEKTVPVADLLAEAIEPDAIYSKAPIDIRNNRLWALKSEPNGVLEGARQMYRNRTNDMHQYVEGLNKMFQENLGASPELRLANDNHYYLRFQWSDVERELMRQDGGTVSGRPTGFHHRRPRPLGGVQIVNGARRKQHYDCQTLELIQRSSQIQRHADIVTGQSDGFVVELKKSLLEHAESLLAVNEAIAVLDMLCSFAHLATTQNYVRPIISDNLVLKGARHPVVEVRRQNFVSNDVYSGDSDARFQVITGGNMSGKSTFIKAIALIQVMAQVGSFVPATSAAIPICDRLFTRLSTEDQPESNLGTFAVEMTDMNMILRQVTKDSLVIIDELGRGTSTKEGLAIALSIAEKLMKTGCRVFFATHFTELARVLNSTEGTSVLNVHVAGESSKSGDTAQITLPHTIAPGPVKNEDYGLDLSHRFLPNHVIKNAEQVYQFFRDTTFSKAAGPATRAVKQNKLILALPDLLKQAQSSTMDDSALSSYLKKLQTEFTIRINIADDDDAPEDQARDKAKVANLPTLQKPSKDDLEEWKKKCDASERRVMSANVVQSQERKRPGSEYETNEGQQKRNKADNDKRCLVFPPTPINRGSMIEELRGGAFTPTIGAVTSHSLTAEIAGTDAGSVMEESPACENMTVEPVTSAYPLRAISISSGSEYDADTSALDDDADFVPAAAEGPRAAGFQQLAQPLEGFQPLNAWYTRESQAQGSSSRDGDEALGSTSLVRSRSMTQEFMHELKENEEE